MNSARSVLLGPMPPAFAAARHTACGRFFANQSATCALLRKSTSLRAAVRSSTPSEASRRTSAPPTMPRWPATKTRWPFSSNGVLAIGHLAPGDCEIAGHHLLDEFGEARLRFPAELLVRLAGVADQKVDLGGTEILRIDPNQRLAGFLVDAGFLDTLAAPFDAASDFGERQFDELAHRAGLARGQHEIVRLICLQDLVHADDVILGMAPVALGVEIAEVKRLLKPGLDPRHRAGDLAGHESFAPDRALMVEQDAVRGEHAVGLAIVHRDPVAVELGDRIRRTRIKRRGFLLRDFLDQAVQFRSRGLIE